MRKEIYVKPVIELIILENEACVMTGSFSGSGQTNPKAYSGGASRGRSYGVTSTSDLEDLINDILTTEK